MSAPEILWLGLHKTGTTTLQAMLAGAEEALRAEGIAVPELQAFRDAHTRPFLDGAPPKGAADPARPGGPRRIVFDENMPALVQDVLSPHGIYPRAASRLGRMAERLEMPRPRLVMGLRARAPWLPSLWVEVLKSLPGRPFRSFAGAMPEGRAWTELAARLAAAGPESLWVYRIEDWRDREADLLAHVTGLPADAFAPPAAPLRTGLGAEAGAAVEAMMRDGAPSDPAAVKAAMAAHPKGDEAFDPWRPEERAALAAADARDMAGLAALEAAGRLRLLRPEGAANGGPASA